VSSVLGLPGSPTVPAYMRARFTAWKGSGGGVSSTSRVRFDLFACWKKVDVSWIGLVVWWRELRRNEFSSTARAYILLDGL
jgi:hypothetical protein